MLACAGLPSCSGPAPRWGAPLLVFCFLFHPSCSQAGPFLRDHSINLKTLLLASPFHQGWGCPVSGDHGRGVRAAGGMQPWGEDTGSRPRGMTDCSMELSPACVGCDQESLAVEVRASSWCGALATQRKGPISNPKMPHLVGAAFTTHTPALTQQERTWDLNSRLFWLLVWTLEDNLLLPQPASGEHLVPGCPE